MKTRFFFVLFAFILFLLIPGSIFAQQSDFYGKWTGSVTVDDERIEMTFIISALDLRIEFKFYIDNELVEEEEMEGEKIEAWVSILNADPNTRENFPSGYSIFFDEEPVDIFISRDKRQLTIPILNNMIGMLVTYEKQ